MRATKTEPEWRWVSAKHGTRSSAEVLNLSRSSCQHYQCTPPLGG